MFAVEKMQLGQNQTNTGSAHSVMAQNRHIMAGDGGQMTSFIQWPWTHFTNALWSHYPNLVKIHLSLTHKNK